MLLKCPYYPKKSTDSMQSLSKFQWYFQRKNPKICMELQKIINIQISLKKIEQIAQLKNQQRNE